MPQLPESHDPTPGEQIRRQLAAVVADPALAWHFVRRIAEAVRRHGVAGLRQLVEARLGRPQRRSYGDWLRSYQALTSTDHDMVRSRIAALRRRPLLSLILPTSDICSAADLASTIHSVEQQWYGNWELVLVSSSAGPDRLTGSLAEFATDGRMTVVPERPESADFDVRNLALAKLSGEYCALVEPAATLSWHALYLVAAELDDHPDAAIIYTDEDEIDAVGRYCRPSFKPDWDPDLLLVTPYLGRLTFYRTELVRGLGGWNADAADAADWDLALHATKSLAPERIRHVPHGVYHTRSGAESTTPGDAEGERLLQTYLRDEDITATVSKSEYGTWRVQFLPPDPPPLVSVIIPTRNAGRLLRRCVRGLLEFTAYPRLELVIVDNQSDDRETLAYLEVLQERHRARVLRYNKPFNFAAINNMAAREARGEVLALLNNDVEVITRDWLSEMVGHALRPDVGAVGAKLYYHDGRIQHAGIVLGLGWVAGHLYRGVFEPDGGMSRTVTVRTVSAVTGACMVLRSSVFREVGGLDEVALPVAYNDVDLCLRLQRRGYRVLWTPFARLYHAESATRGPDRSRRKAQRLRREEQIMRDRWGPLLDRDPAYNPNLTLIHADGSLAFPPRAVSPWRSHRHGVHRLDFLGPGKRTERSGSLEGGAHTLRAPRWDSTR